jgi:hypothetical protein
VSPRLRRACAGQAKVSNHDPDPARRPASNRPARRRQTASTSSLASRPGRPSASTTLRLRSPTGSAVGFPTSCPRINSCRPHRQTQWPAAAVARAAQPLSRRACTRARRRGPRRPGNKARGRSPRPPGTKAPSRATFSTRMPRSPSATRSRSGLWVGSTMAGGRASSTSRRQAWPTASRSHQRRR